MTGGGAVKIADGNFNDTANGYDRSLTISISITGGNPKDVIGTNEFGFTPKSGGGSTSTYYCDGTFMMTSSGYLPYFGGSRLSGAGAGAFYFYCSGLASYAYAGIGARLCFCG